MAAHESSMNTQHENTKDAPVESKMKGVPDISSSFENEHGTRKAWFESIESIIKEATIKTNEAQALKLRFVKDFRSTSRPHDFELTPLEEVPPGTRYITVSYCWQQPEPLEMIPEYRILVDGSYREIRCPSLIFHRAIRFARHKKCDLIWIDQECIKQKSDINHREDLDYHLEVMDRVYGESIHTVAPLSTRGFLEEHTVERLLDWPENETNTAIWSSTFGRFRMDSWFLRAWTMNERFCARELYVLLETNWTPPKRGSPYDYEKLEDDLLITVANARAPNGYMLARMSLLLGDRNLGNNTRKIITGEIRDEEEWKVLYRLWMAMAMCGCKILSDKVTVFGNIFKLPWRLNSNKLNDARFYFPTCVLALMLLNRYPNYEDRQRLYEDEESVFQNWFTQQKESGFGWMREWLEL